MKIPLQKINPSTSPIRKTWDEEKMQELCWSFLEQGQVEPIGVYEDADGYTLVWGHRRVEAARRAGWTEIDSLIVPRDEIDNLIQSGIENLSGEEMSVDDKAEWAQRLVDMGFSQHEIARRTSIPVATISQWLQYKREKEAGVFVHTRNQAKDEGVIKTVKIAQVLGDDLEAKKVVAAKVSADGLTQSQTTEIARAYHDAPSPEVKRKILESRVFSSDTAADILRRSVARVNLEKGGSAAGKDANVPASFKKDFTRVVKEFLDTINPVRRNAYRMVAMIKQGVYSKAALRYTIRKIDQLIDELKTIKAYLEGVE
ncbi:MAG: ParB/RepB/Spo0J family partition protein [Anaerolineales bacterium]